MVDIRHFEKNVKYDISAAVQLMLTKFGTTMHMMGYQKS